MSDLLSHIKQAQHNAACARFLLKEPVLYPDWAITAAFYAAVHFVEASFTTRNEIGHTETTQDRAPKEEKHSYRLRKIRELAQPAWRSYRNLFDASYNVRYLTHGGSQSGQVANRYYSERAVKELVNVDLLTIQKQLEIAFRVNLS